MCGLLEVQIKLVSPLAPGGHKHIVIMWLLPQHQHKSVNRDTATAFYTTSVTPPPIKSHFTGKWKLPCGRSHIVKQAEGEIIKLTHIRSTDALKTE